MAKQHLVKCKYCNEMFDTNTIPFVKPSSNRYAHAACHEQYLKLLSEEEQDKKQLYDYINKLFNGSYNYAGVNTYIKKFKEEYKYTYSGIYKALVYFYEVKGNSVEKANGSIGIVPYVYKDAFNYYYSIWEAQQKNENKNTIVIPERIVTIPNPIRKIKQRKLFSFLDGNEGGAK